MANVPVPSFQKMTLIGAVIPVVALISLLALSYYLFGDEASSGPNQIALLFCALIATFVALTHGFQFDELKDAVVDSVSTGMHAIFILLAVGSLIGTWAMSGTIMAMVYYGLQILSPNYFYFTTVIICALVSVSIGSSWTVAGTIGIGLMGIATKMGLDPAITAGAVLSGAYFGDKSSPLSDATNLATAAAGSNLYAHIKENLWTSIPALAIALVVFWWLGKPGDFVAQETLTSIERYYDITLLNFLPLVLVLGLALVRYPPFTTIFIGALFGGLYAVVMEPDKVIALGSTPHLPYALEMTKGVWIAMSNGYVSVTGDPSIDALLSRGGMGNMLTTIWLIMTALAFGGVVEKAGILDRIIGPILRAAKTTGALVLSLVSTAIATNILAADQYIAIVIPGRMYRKSFRLRRLRPEVLSRAVGDSATVTSALIPWNSCGAYMAATLGVPTLAFAGFAVFNIASPILTVLFAVMGWRMLTMTDHKPERIVLPDDEQKVE
ncbi:Malate-2H(+)/Na(+)-lactate antiporter [Pseudovibrio axinellae]|uniref:Malate-2H(+)/Na(+)-lactate antiporter n=1 Tax=Pseudovibrio axinellae TaxID=989403 RepID=A0A165U1H2_9HYPH|nr:Na+/H+ antiporter NhaC [Pseudovibrio axinellae]KZL09434.1 Malate-2H(+)/Na(+)-lactate antiporter [Pseudovibrio axinellae]SEQ65011.1 transporter, NhaC family [Pseudovibrio axinellae]